VYTRATYAWVNYAGSDGIFELGLTGGRQLGGRWAAELGLTSTMLFGSQALSSDAYDNPGPIKFSRSALELGAGLRYEL
jgi:hypothetical protein